MRIVIACGGTGGHLFPGLAVAEALLARHHEVRLLVSEKAVDQTALRSLTVHGGSALSVRSLPAVGYTGAKQALHFGAGLARATRTCASLCKEFSPDAVLGMGGFTSAPAVIAASWNRAPSLIHESNAIPGKANRWAGILAGHIAVGLADCAPFFGRKPVTVTGTPIRAALRKGKVADAREQLGLDPKRLTVLIVGGSQGARAINDAVASALPWLDGWTERAQFVHLSGAHDEEFVRDAYQGNGFTASVTGFCERMELAYSAADVVVSRAGAGTLTEIAAFGLPAILIPYPFAAADHQAHNARVFERAGAARMIRQSQLGGHHAEKGERLGEAIAGLLGDDAQRHRMSVAAHSLAVPDAEQRIADLIEHHAHQTTTH
jgi:UDP-N-acetylglucosamine--N-acetylmuramyl-(pentapeptide) pyrophosphoryl-undecaprenol N-acetylglucosamine transferase